MVPISLPLIVDAPAGMPDSSALTSGGIPQAVTLQLNSQVGRVSPVSLSEQAAQAAAMLRMNWAPVRRFLSEAFGGNED